MDNNLVKFPGKKDAETVPTLETVETKLFEQRMETIDEITIAIREEMWRLIDIAGFSCSSDNLSLFCMLGECIRAIVCDRFEIDHEFRKLADSITTVDENGNVVLKLPKIEVRKIDADS